MPTSIRASRLICRGASFEQFDCLRDSDVRNRPPVDDLLCEVEHVIDVAVRTRAATGKAQRHFRQAGLMLKRNPLVGSWQVPHRISSFIGSETPTTGTHTGAAPLTPAYDTNDWRGLQPAPITRNAPRAPSRLACPSVRELARPQRARSRPGGRRGWYERGPVAQPPVLTRGTCLCAGLMRPCPCQTAERVR